MILSMRSDKAPIPFHAASVHDFLRVCTERYQQKTALTVFENGKWNSLTFSGLHGAALKKAERLRSAGLKKGDRVVILGENSLDWIVHFFAVILAGGIAVPIDIKLTETEIFNLVRHAEPALILTSGKLRATARQTRFAGGTAAKVLSLDSLNEAQPEEAEILPPAESSPEDIAVICYTSGTTGCPAGVMVAQRAFLFQAEQLYAVSDCLEEKKAVLSILPLNHLFGLVPGVFYSLRCGQELVLAHDLSPPEIARCIQDRQVSEILAIPLFASTIMHRVQSTLANGASPAKLLAYRALFRAMEKFPIAILQGLVFGTLRKKLGKSLKRIICGGAPLDPSMFDFFRAIGIPIYSGYGLTETGPVISINTTKHNRRGSVGKALPGVEVKIVDGEILTRGPHLMSGYYKNPELTGEVITSDGWFRTGDIGAIDNEGYVRILGRKKALIVLSSGKKVHPEEVEAVLGRSRKIGAVCVVGLKHSENSGESVTAVIVPSAEALAEYDIDSPELESMLREETRMLAEELALFKRPLKIILRKEPFEMTSTRKVRRFTVMKELEGVPAK